ncbi:MAG: hypothetical protein K0V04_15650, partial [Deltaproteobacteria bacterium]|nr:hypothetical protein [Deltaproteobacteria bacterium]
APYAGSNADLACAQLADIWRRSDGESASAALFLVPGSFGRDALGLLLGIAGECGIPARAVVDTAVASAEIPADGRAILHFDVHLHFVIVTEVLPANGLAQLGEAFECLPPASVFQPREALAMAVGFARGLMRWKKFQRVPTWLNLRAMWGWPAKGGDPQRLAAVRRKFTNDAADVGLPAAWLDQRPSPLPMTGAEVLHRLQVA